MKPTVKTILVWILILVAAVGLYNFVEGHNKEKPVTLSLNEFLNKVKATPTEVAEVTINGSTIRGKLTSGSQFTSTIPANYPAFYDELTKANVKVTVYPPDPSPRLWEITAIIVVAGSILWFAITMMVLILVADLSKFVRRELSRIGQAGITL